MMSKHTVSLGSVQETLLIPLLGRAMETKRSDGLLNDPRAVEIVEQLDYDFSKWKNISSLSVACVRTRIFDEIAQRFLQACPEGAIVEIGCGLNTRFERIDNGKARWFELDLPDSIALRRSFFEDTPRRTMIAGSVFDDDWMAPVLKEGRPTLFLSEAVIIYFDEPQVKQAVTKIAKAFPDAWFATDICPSELTTQQAQQQQMKRFGIDSWFKWACDEPEAVERWHPGIKLLDSQTLADASPDIVSKMPLVWRALTLFAPFIVRYLTKGYRIAHYRLGE